MKIVRLRVAPRPHKSALDGAVPRQAVFIRPSSWLHGRIVWAWRVHPKHYRFYCGAALWSYEESHFHFLTDLAGTAAA